MNPSCPRHPVPRARTTLSAAEIRIRDQNLFMLPCKLLPEDRAFISDHLPKSKHLKKEALTRYKQAWLGAMDYSMPSHQQQNAGRFAANAWLRLNFVEAQSYATHLPPPLSTNPPRSSVPNHEEQTKRRRELKIFPYNK